MNRIENIPDYPFLRQVQKALWKTGEVHGAAVMIGAGFSRFAVRATDKTPIAPLWKDFREAMRQELYPNNKDYPRDPLVLAEEYRATLGKNALEGLIKNLIRDEERRPGELHESLLTLPWSDVLTTNWDTLLERSAASDPNFLFDIVRVPSDIACTHSPRIIKLHGSIPSHRPFIFTHEDFRTYRTRFAAFVNLARQVFLENELCLLGFSGDDPNFLEWSGWVRDQLGPDARPIRLIGALGISAPRRLFLERLNVTPIDLMPLVRDLPKEDRPRRATERFLEYLREKRPPPKTYWKISPEEQDAEDISCPDGQLNRLAGIWVRARTEHPGWLVTPHPIRIEIKRDLAKNYQTLESNLPKASEPTRASVLHEAVWRCETAFLALPEFLESAISDMVTTDDDGSLSLRKRCLLRASIVRAARHRRDWKAFDKRIKLLERLGGSAAEAEALYERCIRAIDELDFEFIETHVEDITGQDPVWLLRRAALTAELGDSDAAAGLIYEAHREIRQKRTQDRHSLWLLSREAWTFWLMRDFRFLAEEPPLDERPDWPVDYKNAKTDPWDELWSYDYEIEEADRRHRNVGINKQFLFDAGTYSFNLNLLGETVVYPCDDLIVLAERVGIPIRLGSIDFLGDRLARAVQIPDYRNPIINLWVSTRIMIRINDKNLTDSFFGRTAVACLPFEVVLEIAEKLRGVIVFGKNKLAIQNNETRTQRLDRNDWTNRLAMAIELLSRLSARFQGDESLELFRFGVSLVHDPKIKYSTLFRSLGNLLCRSLQALEPERRGEAALDILNLPLPSEKEISGPEDTWLDLSDLLETGTSFQAFENTHEKSERIEFLIKEAADISNRMSRQYAIFRLLFLFGSGLLNESEAEAFGNAIWRHRGSDGFPVATNLVPHAYLELPSPDSDIVQETFDASIVKKLAEGSFDAKSLRAIFRASHPSRQGHKPYRLNRKDAVSILDHALDWRQPPESFPSIFLRTPEESVNFGELVGNALASTVLPSIPPNSMGKGRIRKFLARVSDGSLPELIIALPALTMLDETITEEAVKAIQKGLISQRPYIVNAALRAVSWFEEFARNENLPMPEVLVSETVSICLMRREPGLLSALRCAGKLAESKNIPKSEISRLPDALELLFEETNYENRLDESRRSDIGVIRKAAVTLAATLKDAGIEEPILDRWIAAAESDPMPEVRYALSDPKN